MISHPFVCRNDSWIIEHHLSVYASFCDHIVAILDRSPENEAICRKYGAEIIHWTPAVNRPDFNESGLLWDDGELRQLALNKCLERNPKFIVFGDTDEAPTPDIVEFLESDPDPAADLFLGDWVNLVHSIRSAIGGTECRWSFQKPGSNKKDLVLRVKEGKSYRFPRHLQHVRMDRAGLNVQLLDSPKLIHYKYAAWMKWQANPQSKTSGYADLLDHAEIVPVWADWLWPFAIPELDYTGEK